MRKERGASLSLCDFIVVFQVVPLVYRGVVSQMEVREPKCYHGTYPGAAIAILKHGFKNSSIPQLHEVTPKGGCGIYTFQEERVFSPQKNCLSVVFCNENASFLLKMWSSIVENAWSLMENACLRQ